VKPIEHATLARYLIPLVEGDDLAVSGDRIHIRTVAGLKRLDVLLRRVDSNSLDPLNSTPPRSSACPA